MKTIFVTTDFSVCSLKAVEYSIQLMQQAKCSLIVFNSSHLSKLPEISDKKFENLIKADEDLNKSNLEFAVKKICDKKDYRIPLKRIKCISRFGLLVAENIIAEAVKHKADVIVMGTHGAGGIKKYLFGSNTSEIISKSRIPVIAVPLNYRFKKIKKIVYASDMENLYGELKSVIPFAKTLNAEIDILHLNYFMDKEDEKREQQNLLKKNSAGTGYKNITLTIRKATIDKTLLEQLKTYLRKSRPQLLVMFPGERKWLYKIFPGSKTEELSYNLTIPLMSVRKSALAGA